MTQRLTIADLIRRLSTTDQNAEVMIDLGDEILALDEVTVRSGLCLLRAAR